MLIDITFAILLIIGFTKGYKKGLIKSLFNTIGFMVGITAALKLSATVSTHLSSASRISEKWIPFLSFIIVFCAVVFAVRLLSRLFEKTSEMLMLGWLNRMGGVLLYIFLYCLLFSVVLFYIKQLGIISKQTIDNSVFYPYLSPLAPDVINAIGKIVPFFKDLFAQLNHYFDQVSNKI